MYKIIVSKPKPRMTKEEKLLNTIRNLLQEVVYWQGKHANLQGKYQDLEAKEKQV